MPPPRPGTAKYDEYMRERERKRLLPASERDELPKGSEAKPVGTVFIGMHDARSGITRVGKFLFPFGRERFRNASVACAFLSAWQYLQGDIPTVWPLSHYEAVSKKLT